MIEPANRAGGGFEGDERTTTSPPTLPAGPDRPPLRLVRSARPPRPDPVEEYLLELVARGGPDVPMIDELTAADLGTPRGTASIARAALSNLRSKHPDVIRADLERELAEDDLLVRVRLRHMIGDLAEVPWSRLHEVARARAEWGDRRYRRAGDGDGD